MNDCLLPIVCCCWLTAMMLSPAAVKAQFLDEAPAGGVSFGKEETHRYQIGVRVTASQGACKKILATIPVPQDWPEQSVRMVGEEVSSQVRKVSERKLNGVTQMIVEIPLINKGDEAHALRTYEIRRRAIIGPEETSQYRIPTRKDRNLQIYLGTSPYIESRNAQIRSLAKKIVEESSAGSDWEKVEAIYDYVRTHIEYTNGSIKGAVQALRDGHGDCEEMSSLFIALSRAAKVPSRLVWVPDHCYAEFYLEDAEGAGHWFPCQPAGTRAFGEMPEARPILQKGDNFRVPEKPRQPQRYVAEFLSGKPVRGGGKPHVEFVRILVD